MIFLVMLLGLKDQTINIYLCSEIHMQKNLRNESRTSDVDQLIRCIGLR